MSRLRQEPVVITAQDVLKDRHGAKYRDVVERTHRGAFERVVGILDDPDHQQQLLAAERFGRPALSGVVDAIESDDVVAASLASPGSLRFRQAVGVAVRITMEALGWAATGRKGPVRGASTFRTAERYQPPPADPGAARARAALQAIEAIGHEDERRETARTLLVALADTRRRENRPF